MRRTFTSPFAKTILPWLKAWKIRPIVGLPKPFRLNCEWLYFFGSSDLIRLWRTMTTFSNGSKSLAVILPRLRKSRPPAKSFQLSMHLGRLACQVAVMELNDTHNFLSGSTAKLKKAWICSGFFSETQFQRSTNSKALGIVASS